MRSHEKYLEKVRDEMDVFRAHLIHGEELTTQQAETFEKINIARAWLKEGHSDSEVIDLLSRDPRTKLASRRAREVVVLAYNIFADLRQARTPEGVKYLYAEEFREAAKLAKAAGDYDAYIKLLKEAAKIDGAYDEQKVDQSEKKKARKVIIQRATINNFAGTSPAGEPKVIDVNHEELDREGAD